MANFNFLSGSGNLRFRFQVKVRMNFREMIKKSWVAKERCLRRAGAIIRGIMRRKIRRVKNPRLASQPGKPPYAHFYPGIKNSIQFATHVSAFRSWTIVGPQIDRSKPNISPVPGALEHGGQTLVRVNRNHKKKPKRKLGPPVPPGFRPGKKVNIKAKMQARNAVVKRRAKIRQRPYAKVSLEAFVANPAYRQIWKGCIK